MKTDDLIRALAADRDTALPAGRLLLLAGTAGFALSALAFVIELGPRPDLAQAVASARFLFKPLLMLALAVLAGVALLRLAQPGVPVRLSILAAVPTALAAGVALELVSLPTTQWMPALIGRNWHKCITLIPLLSLPLLAALLLGLRRSAPTRPATAGAIAGFTAGGLAAVLYALNCRDDSPLFVALWYGLAIATVGLAGALAGRKMLRW
jgi:hypothetical protein